MSAPSTTAGERDCDIALVFSQTLSGIAELVFNLQKLCQKTLEKLGSPMQTIPVPLPLSQSARQTEGKDSQSSRMKIVKNAAIKTQRKQDYGFKKPPGASKLFQEDWAQKYQILIVGKKKPQIIEMAKQAWNEVPQEQRSSYSKKHQQLVRQYKIKLKQLQKRNPQLIKKSKPKPKPNNIKQIKEGVPKSHTPADLDLVDGNKQIKMDEQNPSNPVSEQSNPEDEQKFSECLEDQQKEKDKIE